MKVVLVIETSPSLTRPRRVCINSKPMECLSSDILTYSSITVFSFGDITGTKKSRRDSRQDSDMGESIGAEVLYLRRSAVCHTKTTGPENNERATEWAIPYPIAILGNYAVDKYLVYY